MYQLFQHFLNIMLLRARPQDLPGQPVVLWIAVTAAFVSGFAGFLFVYDFSAALGRSMLSVLIPGIAVWLLLRIRRLQHRFNQTFAALCGSAAVINAIAFPFMPYLFNAGADAQAGTWLIVLTLLIDIWSVVITAHIFRHALDIGFASGISLSIALILVTVVTIESVLPLPNAAADHMTSLSEPAFLRAGAMDQSTG